MAAAMILMNMTRSKPVPSLLVWLLIVVIRYLFFFEINEALWILSVFADAVLLGGGMYCAAMSLHALFRRTAKGAGVLSLAAVAVVAVLFGFTSFGHDLGLYSRLWRNESGYREQINAIATDGSRAERERFAYPTIIDEGPPVRVAFSWGGIIDNWYGIVYDPTGEVARAGRFRNDRSRGNDLRLHEVRKLFGGDMTSARHLWGPWYYCTFT